MEHNRTQKLIHKYAQIIFSKGAKTIQKKRDSPLKKWCWIINLNAECKTIKYYIYKKTQYKIFATARQAILRLNIKTMTHEKKNR